MTTKPPRPGTYPPPPGMQWVRKQAYSKDAYIILGILGIPTLGLTWIVLLIVLFIEAGRGKSIVLEPIPTTYVMPPPQMYPTGGPVGHNHTS